MFVIRVSKLKLILFLLYALPSVTFANPVTVKAAEWTKVDNIKQCDEGNCNTFKNIELNNIFIYCYNGNTISPMIVAIYLIKYGGISSDMIHEILRSKKETICIDYNLSLLPTSRFAATTDFLL